MQDSETTQTAIQEFIEHHVMQHTGSPKGWNVPFAHINALEWFKYDSVMLCFVVLLLLGLGIAVRRRYGSVPRGIAALAEMYVLFIRDHIVCANLGKETGRRFVPFFCTLFIFIFAGNFLGLIPLFSTVTGSISVTAGLATMFMVVSLVAVVRLRGFAGLKGAFVLQGLPPWLTPFMTVIEVISFFARVFALTMRLFCNMLAGHIVICSLLGLVLVYGWAASPVLPVVVFMWFFELFVSVLQAYIFTLLAAIFMNMMVNPSH
ncbi:MAG: F0F1 ATP synthase subunit A [Kiritimatiellaeota bacterium]|nr:F0F1 ATP synthase subunit A [Kiritimatiellota bacterium]